MANEPNIKRVAYALFLSDIIDVIDDGELKKAILNYFWGYPKPDAPDLLSYLMNNTSAKERYLPFDKFVETLYTDEDYVCALLKDEKLQSAYLSDLERL